MHKEKKRLFWPTIVKMPVKEQIDPSFWDTGPNDQIMLDSNAGANCSPCGWEAEWGRGRGQSPMIP